MQPDNPQTATQDFPPQQESSWSEYQEVAPAEKNAGKSREIAEEVRRKGAETIRRTREQGEAFLGEQKHSVAETIHHCSDALRGAAQQLHEKQDRNLATLTETIAERLDKTSNYLEAKELQDIRSDVENFARQQPQIFYGSMFVAGLALSRFFKASKSESYNEPDFMANEETEVVQ